MVRSTAFPQNRQSANQPNQCSLLRNLQPRCGNREKMILSGQTAPGGLRCPCIPYPRHPTNPREHHSPPWPFASHQGRNERRIWLRCVPGKLGTEHRDQDIWMQPWREPVRETLLLPRPPPSSKTPRHMYYLDPTSTCVLLPFHRMRISSPPRGASPTVRNGTPAARGDPIESFAPV